MTAHEVACIEARLTGVDVDLVVRNALAGPADPAWLEDVDGLVIGGSGSFSVHHPESRPWVEPLHDVLGAALLRGMPGLGICFGHQLLGEHLGATVRTDEARKERGTIDVHTTAASKGDPLFSGLADDGRLPVHTGHSDLVDRTPYGVTLLASTPLVEQQAFRVDGLPFWSVQFHPDLTAADAHARYEAFVRDAGGDPSTIPAFLPHGDVSTELVARLATRL
jgi:GMP synthase (glutamine-hydrolysing)